MKRYGLPNTFWQHGIIIFYVVQHIFVWFCMSFEEEFGMQSWNPSFQLLNSSHWCGWVCGQFGTERNPQMECSAWQWRAMEQNRITLKHSVNVLYPTCTLGSLAYYILNTLFTKLKRCWGRKTFQQQSWLNHNSCHLWLCQLKNRLLQFFFTVRFSKRMSLESTLLQMFFFILRQN